MHRNILQFIFQERSCIFIRKYYKKVNQTWKRGSMLNKLLIDKDIKKDWHLKIMQNSVKSKNVFESVHRPSKRQNVLNSLFIKNISDVLSTGDIAPEILGLNIEITGVKISPCCKILNVYWQIPPHNFESHEDIATVLNLKGPRIRAELISRNLMGRVPQIFFIRDISNAYLADFEKALKIADLGPLDQINIIPEDSFTKNIYSFKEPKVLTEEEIQAKTPNHKSPSQILNIPERPPNMKTDVFGIKHSVLMGHVIDAKIKSKNKATTHVIINPEWKEEGETDLFDKIPGTSLHEDSKEMDREQLLKKFYIHRKMMRKQAMKYDPMNSNIEVVYDYEEPTDESDVIDDFVEEDITERF